jgi:hypothetical protein
MSKAKGNPASQSFCVSPRRNLTKKNSWWAKAPFHNNSVKKAK